MLPQLHGILKQSLPMKYQTACTYQQTVAAATDIRTAITGEQSLEVAGTDVSHLLTQAIKALGESQMTSADSYMMLSKNKTAHMCLQSNPAHISSAACISLMPQLIPDFVPICRTFLLWLTKMNVTPCLCAKPSSELLFRAVPIAQGPSSSY